MTSQKGACDLKLCCTDEMSIFGPPAQSSVNDRRLLWNITTSLVDEARAVIIDVKQRGPSTDTGTWHDNRHNVTKVKYDDELIAPTQQVLSTTRLIYDKRIFTGYMAAGCRTEWYSARGL